MLDRPQTAPRMTPPAKRRGPGRPLDSGIDDSAVLVSVKKMMRQEGVCPTQAIKRCGIDDASSIRRIRDKVRMGKKK